MSARAIRYQRMDRMDPRDGINYATVYVKQTRDQRASLVQHIKIVVKEIAEEMERNPSLDTWMNTPLKNFKTTTGKNRTPADIIQDMIAEASGKKRDGSLKDFALAPIERWNKLFKDSEYAIELVQTFNSKPNNFHDIMEIFQNDE